MYYVITDGNFYSNIRLDLNRANKTKFLKNAQQHKTKKEAESYIRYAKIVLRHSTLEIKKIYKKDELESKFSKAQSNARRLQR